MSKIGEWLGAAERKLDANGRPAWLAAMVAGFILVWPVGLAILGYMLWSGRMGWGCGKRARRMAGAMKGSGNTAFDAYREETLRRLEDEQKSFGEYLDRLRRAKDQAEFDAFRNEGQGAAATA